MNGEEIIKTHQLINKSLWLPESRSKIANTDQMQFQFSYNFEMIVVLCFTTKIYFYQEKSR